MLTVKFQTSKISKVVGPSLVEHVDCQRLNCSASIWLTMAGLTLGLVLPQPGCPRLNRPEHWMPDSCLVQPEPPNVTPTRALHKHSNSTVTALFSKCCDAFCCVCAVVYSPRRVGMPIHQAEIILSSLSYSVLQQQQQLVAVP